MRSELEVITIASDGVAGDETPDEPESAGRFGPISEGISGLSLLGLSSAVVAPVDGGVPVEAVEVLDVSNPHTPRIACIASRS